MGIFTIYATSRVEGKCRQFFTFCFKLSAVFRVRTLNYQIKSILFRHIIKSSVYYPQLFKWESRAIKNRKTISTN